MKPSIKQLVAPLVVVVSALVGGLNLTAQTFNYESMGLPPLSAYDDHGTDVIDLVSLVPRVKIPFITKQGAIPYAVSAYMDSGCYPAGQRNSSYWVCVGGGIQPTGPTDLIWSYPAGSGSPIRTLVGGSGTSVSFSYKAPTACGGGPQGAYYADWYITTPDGSTHFFGGTVYSCSAAGPTSMIGTAIDGSGLTAYVAFVSGGLTDTFNATVWNASGDYVSSGTGSTPEYDPYGNTISNYGQTDTLGIQVLTYSSQNVNYPKTWTATWQDTSNNNQSIQSSIPSSLSASRNFTTSCNSGSACYETPGGQPLSIDFITTTSFPDGTSMTFTPEQGPGGAGTTTGRLASFTTRAGGTISYTYGQPWCYDCNLTTGIAGHPSNGSLTRTTSDGTWQYSFVTGGTQILDPGMNKTVYTFNHINSQSSEDYFGSSVLQTVTTYQNTGTVSAPAYTLLSAKTICYNGTTPPGCAASPGYSWPITEQDVYTTLGSMATSSRVQTMFDSYGNTTSVANYDFGASSPTLKTTTTYGTWNGSTCVSIGNYINNRPCDVKTVDGASHTISEKRFGYDSKGSLLTAYVWNGSAWLSNSTPNVYNPNGTPSVIYDLANNPTTYQYDSSKYYECLSCTNYPFPTSISKGGLTTYSTWNGLGGVKLSDKDASGNTTTYCYTTGTGCSGGTVDPFWRPQSATDPLGNVVNKTYPSGFSPTTLNSSFAFNSGNSTQNITGTIDGYGRSTNTQTKQSPSAANYDTTSKQYGWSGTYRQIQSTLPCSTTSASQCSFSSATTTSLIDALGRPYTITDGGGGVVTKTYPQNDVLTVLSPSPSGENNKQFQKEYDGLGRLTKSCAIGNGSTTACGQNTGTANGLTTSYAYTYAAGSSTTTVTRGSQTRSTTADAMGRITQKVIPETGALVSGNWVPGTWNFYYDSYSSCPTGYQGATGRVAASKDPNGNLVCYAYDSLGRATGVNANGTTCRHFYYDNSTGYSGSIPSGVSTPINSLGRMVEAATDSCSSGTLITDEWFSYDQDGQITDMWEMTPHSSQYYHSIAKFFENGKVKSLQLASPNLYTVTYTLDGEGRWDSITDTTTGQALVAGPKPPNAMYNPAGQPIEIDLTGTDKDLYTYDSAGRMKTFTFQVGTTPKTMVGTLNWNTNGTLNNLAIVDGFNSGGTQTCNFNSTLPGGKGYDDWARLLGVDCGSGQWGQTFSYDNYDNLSKLASITGRIGTTWTPVYNTSNNHCNGCTYDTNGDVTGDGNNVYGWNEFSKLKWTATSGTPTCGTSGRCAIYDAFGRIVEQSIGTTWRQRWITQLGETALMTGTSPSWAYWPAPGGGRVLIYGNSTAYDYLHADWLGNARIDSDLGTHAIATDQAYSPYGELYDIFGSNVAQNEVFAGLTGNFAPGTTTPVVWDTPNRELSMIGRWLSPDPAGAGWNQYAYATNPNSSVDPSGLWAVPTGGFHSCPGGFNPCYGSVYHDASFDPDADGMLATAARMSQTDVGGPNDPNSNLGGGIGSSASPISSPILVGFGAANAVPYKILLQIKAITDHETGTQYALYAWGSAPYDPPLIDESLQEGSLIIGVAGAIESAAAGVGASTADTVLPTTLARVIPNGINATTLGAPGAADVFVTDAAELEGLSAQQIATKLGIPESPTGFQVIEFPTPSEGLASPILRSNPGFVGGGQTSGGAVEYVIPNGPIPPTATIRVVQ